MLFELSSYGPESYDKDPIDVRYLRLRKSRHLCYCIGVTPTELSRILANTDSFYREWAQEKNGKTRTINPPREPLAGALKSLNCVLQEIGLPPYMTGSIKGRSALKNGIVHTNQPAILKADISDFFPSIDRELVKQIFQVRLQCSEQIAGLLSGLCTYKNALPQGSPTSPILANLAVEHMAFRLNNLALKHNLRFTQYLDDITISGPLHQLRLIQDTVRQIVKDEGFVCHPTKFQIISREIEQIVTGVRVNHGKDIPRAFLQGIRADIAALPTCPPLASIRRLNGQITHAYTLNRGSAKQLKRELESKLRSNTIQL